MDQRARRFHHRTISDPSQKRWRDRPHAGACLYAQFRHRKALQDGRLKGKKRHGPWQRSRPAERRQFRQPKVRVPEEARGCQASSSRETARGRASSSRARRRGFRQEDRGSLRDRRHRAPRAPRKASAAGRQSPSMARRMSAAHRKFAGLIAKPMPPSPIEARARQHPRSRVPDQQTGPARGRSGAAFGEAS